MKPIGMDSGAEQQLVLPILSPVTLASGERKLLWTRFNPEQVDIDVRHPQAEAYLDSILRKFQAAGIKLIRLRNTHPAFSGEFQVDVPAEDQIQMQWKRQEHWIKLHVDLSFPSASVMGTGIQHWTIPNAADHGLHSEEVLS